MSWSQAVDQALCFGWIDGGLTEAARSYLEERPPWYRRASTHWVVSAKREETRSKRLATLVECSEQGLDVPPLRRA